ncbi:DUF6804 family protein [uncultured Parabacteroides sp.]|uniref:DUF6804 family protein n=1 Tax=uncultured Parabacteroides sp. TaxID=512312 RepID=UPI00258727E1|nr:DUF6804 family protein [uncultured Parabacteroides sp.]
MNKHPHPIILGCLLLLCLAPMPYGYYQFIRLVATGSFAYWAYRAKQRGEEREMWIFLILAILFQPIFKIALGRTIWNTIDVIVGIYLIKKRQKI